jgi:hypothetical protein
MTSLVPSSPLTNAQFAHAWRAGYRAAIDDLPDREIAWEADLWRQLGAPTIAGLCRSVLDERRGAGLSIDGGASVAGLASLWCRSNQRAALTLATEEHVPLVTAMRIQFWSSHQEGQANA